MMKRLVALCAVSVEEFAANSAGAYRGVADERRTRAVASVVEPAGRARHLVR
jgi:hypothetical protein